MRNVRPAFDIWKKPEGYIPPGYQEIKRHLIFDIKMGEKFRQKARFVGGSHMMETPTTMTYDYVVLSYSVSIVLTIADFNGLYIFSCDINNAYLNSECQENIWDRSGPVFSLRPEQL